jgi:hypothetical protein
MPSRVPSVEKILEQFYGDVMQKHQADSRRRSSRRRDTVDSTKYRYEEGPEKRMIL